MRIILATLLLFQTSYFAHAETVINLKYAAAPADNPLKGFVPYIETDSWERFPHSMEFHYFPLCDLMSGYDSFDWKPIEEKLAITQERGCQLTFRVMLEYPGRPNCVPQFLIDDGVKITKWKTDNPNEGVSHTPDYEDPKLRRTLTNFITALGKRFDGDPGVSYITAGILGSWGEWHTYPKVELWASKETQEIVLNAYEAAFKKTPILLRYPAKDGHWDQAPNHQRRFGYHDDSFAWATLETRKDEDSWFFETLLKNANATEKWRTQPIGGELRPELWTTSFTGKTHHPQEQDFAESVRRTHVSWLMDSGLFEKRFPLPDARKEAAIQAAQLMGYEFHIPKVTLNEGRIRIFIENRGVAPIYHDWPAEVWIGDAKAGSFGLTGILPQNGDADATVRELDIRELKEPAQQRIRIRVPNPMPNGKPLRFANTEQQADGWLIIQE